MHTTTKYFIAYILNVHKWALPAPQINFDPSIQTLKRISTKSRIQKFRSSCMYITAAIYTSISLGVLLHSSTFSPKQEYSFAKFVISEISAYFMLLFIPLASVVPPVFYHLTRDARLVETINQLTNVHKTLHFRK